MDVDMDKAISDGHGSSYGNSAISGGYAVLGNVYHNYSAPQPDPAEATKRRLLNDLYFESIDTRKNNILSAHAATCAWIWNTSFADWVRSSKPVSNIFWTCGKPGSGKSTLMKYLLDSTELKSALPQAGWIVVDFFFDFRQRQSIGNTLHGLLRSLLLQILRSQSAEASVLPTAAAISDFSITALKNTFDKVFAALRAHIFVLVDGLDEFSGNMKQLVEFLLSLSGHSNVRLCLASRPHAMIELMLPSYSLQMSDHNSHGIRQYLDQATKNFDEALTESKWRDIRSQIEQRAEGVFLWVYYVLEEILQACANGDSTEEEVEARLHDIPDELDALYQRILDNIQKERAAEAAILYTLVDRGNILGCDMNLAFLQSVMAFISSECCHDSNIVITDDENHFKRRLHSTIGGFFHFQKQGLDLKSEFYREHIGCAAAFIHVSLMHRTVSSFMSRASWVENHLPPSFIKCFPDHIFQRLFAMALTAADARCGPKLEVVLARMHGSFASMEEFRASIQEITNDKVLTSWTALLRYSIQSAMTILRAGPSCGERLVAVLQSRLASLCFALSRWTHRDALLPPDKCMEACVGDLMIAAAWGRHEYLEFHEERIRRLQDYHRDGILVHLMYAMRREEHYCNEVSEWTMKPLKYHCHDEGDLIDMVMSYQKVTNSFHVALYILLQRSISSTLTKKLAVNSDGQLCTTVHLPQWNGALRGCLLGRELLFIWACGVEKYDVHADLDSFCDRESQLLQLFSVGVDVKYRREDGTNVVHYLIGEHIFGHFFGLFVNEKDAIVSCCSRSLEVCWNGNHYHYVSRLIETLCLIEAYGGDFTGVGKHGTPLQTFQYHRARLFQQFQSAMRIHSRMGPEYCDELGLETTMIILDELGFILQHKEDTGHLPQPEVNEEEFEHYRCWPRKPCELCVEEVDNYDVDTQLSEDFENHLCFNVTNDSETSETSEGDIFVDDEDA